MLRRYFGRAARRRSTPNQLKLAFAAVEAGTRRIAEAEPPSPPKQPRSPSQRRARRLQDLPVLETITNDLPPEEKTGPDGIALVKIRERGHRGSRLSARQALPPSRSSGRSMPARPTPAHRASRELPARVIPGGQAAAGLVAHGT